MRQALVLLSAVLIVGCGAPEVDRAPGPSDDGSAVLASFPSNAPDHFGFGSDASAARVAMWDIDVKPDGEGLPPGSGTVAQGQRVFLTHCVACHGATGTEGPNDRLVGTAAWEQWPNGQTVGNYWPYATTLYDYINRAMPRPTPGMLTPDQVYSLVAWILAKNEIIAEDAVMNAETLPAVVMPARDRFVPDDRRGGPEVR